MPDDPILSNAPPPPTREPEIKRACEFCGCTLTARGEVLKFSDEAKLMRKQKEMIEELNGTIATLRDELERAKQAIASSPVPEKRRGLFFGS